MNDAEFNRELSIEVGRMMRELMPREPRHRYWTGSDGREYIYSTERNCDGKFIAAVRRPTGPGSQSGRAAVNKRMRKKAVLFVVVKQSCRRKKKDALALLNRWYSQREAELKARAKVA